MASDSLYRPLSPPPPYQSLISDQIETQLQPHELKDFVASCRTPFAPEHALYLTGFDESRLLTVVQLWCLNCFCNALQIPSVNSMDEATIRWLCSLYLGYLPHDDQLNNLPFPVVPGENRVDALHKLFAHMSATVDTLQGLSDFYFAGFIHLLSRRQSQEYVKNPGEYLFRLSNSEIGTVIISTSSYHMYLSRTRFWEATGMSVIPLELTEFVKSYHGREFVISHLSLRSIIAFVKRFQNDFGLLRPQLVPLTYSLDMFNQEYGDYRFSLYRSVQERQDQWNVEKTLSVPK